MKKLNLLSKTEMKRVIGGYQSLGGCTSDSQCPGQWCCPNMSDPSQDWSCQTPEPQTMPVSDEKVLMCPL